MASYLGPVVSVVIPTRNRPDLVLRAINSALYQTFTHFEVVVIIDGPDERTREALRSLEDERVTVVALDSTVGGAEARNIGVQRSRGQYIAFLDDDDEWSSCKLLKQMALMRESTSLYPVITCRVIAERSTTHEIWPARRRSAGEPMSEYLLCRQNSIRQGEGFIQTSTLLAPRELLLLVPFQTGLPRHQDWDWAIRAAEVPGVDFIWAWEPLVVYHIDSTGKSVSGGQAISSSVRWVANNHLITAKARAYFYATQVAVRCTSAQHLWAVLRNTVLYPRAMFIGLALVFTPRSLVHNLNVRRFAENA